MHDASGTPNESGVAWLVSQYQLKDLDLEDPDQDHKPENHDLETENSETGSDHSLLDQDLEIRNQEIIDLGLLVIADLGLSFTMRDLVLIQNAEWLWGFVILFLQSV